MKNVGQMKTRKPAGTIQSTAIICMAAACMIATSPALAQDAMGRAQNGSDHSAIAKSAPAATSSTQDERTGVSRPDTAAITVTPYSDDTDSITTLPPAKPTAATPQPAPAALQAKRSAPAPAAASKPSVALHSAKQSQSRDLAAFDPDANIVTFDPDANIVTEETAGRADSLLLSGTQNEVKQYQDTGFVTRVPSRPGEVPNGTLVKAKLMEELSTLTTAPGSSFTAELSEPVMRDGQVVVPAGALLAGRVTLVRQGMRIGPAAAIHLQPETITLPDGSQYALDARVIDTDSWDDTKVDHEGTILRKDHGKATAATTSLSAGAGMTAGAIVGGVPGALIGAGVGAGVSAVVWARQDRQADLPEGLSIVFCLTEPMRTTPLSAHLKSAGGVGTE